MPFSSKYCLTVHEPMEMAIPPGPSSLASSWYRIPARSAPPTRHTPSCLVASNARRKKPRYLAASRNLLRTTEPAMPERASSRFDDGTRRSR